MNFTRDRLRSLGWAFVLAVCTALTLLLIFRVNAVKSQVRLAEREIVALKRQKMLLETEIETRASQQQLRNLNDVEFGYSAPTPRQYLAGERQLAAFGKPAAPDAPEPIRVAGAVGEEHETVFQAMVSPITGKAVEAEKPKAAGHKIASNGNLKDRLSRIQSRGEMLE